MTHQLDHNLSAIMFMLSEMVKKNPSEVLQCSFSQYKIVRKRITLILINIKINLLGGEEGVSTTV